MEFSISKEMIPGVYINKNFNSQPCSAEIPQNADRLILYQDNTFHSNFYGTGTYKINFENAISHINLSYNYEYGKGGFSTTISKTLFGRPEITLDNCDHFYEKIK